jgi:hypothetical protein
MRKRTKSRPVRELLQHLLPRFASIHTDDLGNLPKAQGVQRNWGMAGRSDCDQPALRMAAE